MTKILLIRHGENDFINNGKLAGHLPDVHLNERGKTQAKALAELLAPLKLKAIYTSPLERTMETAEPIAAAQRLQVIPREGLGEIHYGSWQGRSIKVLRKRKLWSIVQISPSLARFPSGESFPEAQDRVVNELENIRASHKNPKAVIACVLHSDPIKLAIAHYIGLPLDLYQRLTIEPASISILDIHPPHTRLVCLNDTRATDTGSQG